MTKQAKPTDASRTSTSSGDEPVEAKKESPFLVDPEELARREAAAAAVHAGAEDAGNVEPWIGGQPVRGHGMCNLQETTWSGRPAWTCQSCGFSTPTRKTADERRAECMTL